jgi:hypothetical protein
LLTLSLGDSGMGVVCPLQDRIRASCIGDRKRDEGVPGVGGVWVVLLGEGGC